MLALAMVPITIAVGVAADMGNRNNLKAQLQAATDAATLAAGKEFNKTEGEMQAIADSFFHSNFKASGNASSPSVTLTKSETDDVDCIQVEGMVVVENTFMRVVDNGSDVIKATAEACQQASGLEVVLVFDNTGSMNSYGRLSALKQAAKDFTDILFGSNETSETVKIALVPFSSAVNVGTSNSTAAWLDRSGQADFSKLNFKSNNWHNWKAWNKLTNRSWTGCVEARKGALAVDDTPPTTGNTLFTPYFAPDEPGNSTYRSIISGNYYYNSYLSDSRTNSLDNRQRHQGKYNNKSVNTTSRGPSSGCSVNPIMPLNGTKATIKDNINAMSASGHTMIPEGVGWGLRVLSHHEPFSEGVDKSLDENKNVTKVMVLLTDGENYFATTGSNHNKSRYGAYGYLAQNRVGTTSTSQADNKLNTLTTQACNNVRNAGIITYTFAYQVNNSTARQIIKNCAYDESKYFDPPSSQALKANFRKIANELRDLYLSR